MTIDKPRTTYSTETVRQILERATGTPYTAQDVYNLCRRGYALHGAQKVRGSFLPIAVTKIAQRFTARRLAASLGRKSPRFLDRSHHRACTTCQALAVEWAGVTLCENGHKFTTTTGESDEL